MKFSTEVTVDFLSKSLNPDYYKYLNLRSDIKITDKIKYRYKTQEEFESQYGVEWRNKISGGWGEHMDILLGMPFTHEFPDGLEHVYRNNCNTYRSMIVEYTQEQKDVINKLNSFIKPVFEKDGITNFFDQYTGNNFTVNTGSTGNCQLSTMSYYNNLMNYIYYGFENDVNSKIVWTMLRLILANTPYIKPLLHLDVQKSYYKYIEDWPNVLSAGYTSTNGNSMVCVYLKLI
jgi:hypothetical protein